MAPTHYETAVVDYLRADRALFVNTECCIQLHPAENPDLSGAHWYCDAVAVDFRAQSVFLCEFSYANPPKALGDRLAEWYTDWPKVCAALLRDSHLPKDWPIRPWLFVPEAQINWIVGKIRKLQADASLSERIPDPRITPLELAQPWKYRSWDRVGELPKPASIPESMQA